MKIMLDVSPEKLRSCENRYSHEFWQLITPLRINKLAGVPYGIDNGCYSRFKKDEFCKLIDNADRDRTNLQWIVCPDMVADAQRTRELYDYFARKHLRGLPIAYVLQDNCQFTRIPYDEVECLFVGGTTPFKTSDAALNAVRTAKMIKPEIMIHVGRVNSFDRAEWWIAAGERYGFKVDSCDGSGMSRFGDTKYDTHIQNVLSAIRDDHPQVEIAI